MEEKAKKPRRARKFKYDMTLIRAAVHDYDVLQMSQKEVLLKYGISSGSSLHYWRKIFSSEIVAKQPELHTMTEEEKRDMSLLQQKIQFLEKTLEDSRLKVTVLETLIIEAEEELGIDIKKKSGTRQSDE